ncbi:MULTISPECIES: potassium channel family protein [unclassified Corynebacterium]|uniref:potassium channel family protein n=1 Tax=unclassified Corynebacterium TaxID=2624378 RepID=UPI0030B49761
MFSRRADTSPVVILGMGRFGQALGEELRANGIEVLCVDFRERVVQELSATFDHVVTADTTQPEVLRQLGVHEAERVVIAIGSDIEASLLTASAVVDMGVPLIWAKADNQAHAKILGQIGVHHVIRPEADTGRRVAHLIGGKVQDYLEFDRDFAIAKIVPPVAVQGKNVSEINAIAPVTVLALRPRCERFRPALDDDIVNAGDLLIVSGPVEKLEDFASD